MRSSGTYPVVRAGIIDLAGALEAFVHGERRHRALEVSERLRALEGVMKAWRPGTTDGERNKVLSEVQALQDEGWALLRKDPRAE